MTDKSDSGFIEKVEHYENEDTIENKPAKKGEAEVIKAEETTVPSQSTAEKPTATPSQVHHQVEGIPTKSTFFGGDRRLSAYPRPSQQVKSRSQIAEVSVQQASTGVKAQNRNTKGSLVSSKAEDAERKREAENAQWAKREEEEKEPIVEQTAFRKETEKGESILNFCG